MTIKLAMSVAIFSALLGACAPPANANANSPRYDYLIDSVCLSSAIELPRMASKMSDAGARELPREQAANIPAEQAWLLLDNEITVIAAYRSRVEGGQSLRDCVLAFRDGDHAAAARYIESAYRVRRVVDERQGGQRFTAYTGDLIGLPSAIISIQSILNNRGLYTITVTKRSQLPR